MQLWLNLHNQLLYRVVLRGIMLASKVMDSELEYLVADYATIGNLSVYETNFWSQDARPVFQALGPTRRHYVIKKNKTLSSNQYVEI